VETGLGFAIMSKVIVAKEKQLGVLVRCRSRQADAYALAGLPEREIPFAPGLELRRVLQGQAEDRRQGVIRLHGHPAA